MPNREPHPDLPVARIESSMQWWWASGRAARGIVAAFLVFVFVYLGGILFVGMGPINAYAWDVFVQLDGGWRVYQGQVPHRDFYSALGALEYSITAIGFVLTKGSASGIPVGNVVFGCVASVWGWFLARRRMPLVPSLLVASWLLVTATCPAPVGAAPHTISGAMVYNRHAYVLLAILLIECVFSSSEPFWDGVSSGVVLILIGFLKLNFFGAAVVLLLVSLLFRWREKQRASGFVLGALAALVVFMLFLRFSLTAFVGDLSLAVKSRASSLSRTAIVHGLIGLDRELAGIVLATVSLALLAAAGTRRRIEGVRVLVMGLAVILTGLMILETDYGEAGITLASLWLLIVAGHLSSVYAKTKDKLAISLVVLLCLSAIYADFSNAAKTYFTLLSYRKQSQIEAGLTIPNRNVSGMRFYEDNVHPLWENNGSIYIQRVNEGLSLLKKLYGPDDRILTLGQNNPFPFILHAKPMHGGATWLQLGSNLSLQHLPAPERIFGDATILMISRAVTSNDVNDHPEALAAAYGPFINTHFVLVARSPNWNVYRRHTM